MLDRVCEWLVARRPAIFIHGGLVLFAAACVESEHLPVEALLVGPGLMVAGALAEAWGK